MKYLIVSMLMILVFTASDARASLYLFESHLLKPIERHRLNANASHGRIFDVRFSELFGDLLTEQGIQSLEFPIPDGRQVNFQLSPARQVTPALANRFPDLKAFQLVDPQNPANYGRLDLTPNGFHAMILFEGQTIYLTPLQRGNPLTYINFYHKDRLPLDAPQPIISQ